MKSKYITAIILAITLYTVLSLYLHGMTNRSVISVLILSGILVLRCLQDMYFSICQYVTDKPEYEDENAFYRKF